MYGDRTEADRNDRSVFAAWIRARANSVIASALAAREPGSGTGTDDFEYPSSSTSAKSIARARVAATINRSAAKSGPLPSSVSGVGGVRYG